MIVMFVAFNSPPAGHQYIPPPGLVLGQMHHVFVSEAECNSFIEAQSDAIKAGVVEATQTVSGIEVVTHELTCIADTDGQPT